MTEGNARILILDIETAPNIAYVWGAWKQNIGQNQWKEKMHIMSFAAKWLNEEEVIYEENRTSDDSQLVGKLFTLLDQADIVVAHNGKRFDLPTILGRGLVNGFPPPSPYWVVDTLLVARKEFRFVSNTLAALTKEMGVKQKSQHKKFPGFELWLECLRGNDEAWEEMKDYNIDDILSLEELYLKMRPFIRNHPNVVRTVKNQEDVCCSKCGSSSIQYRGYYFSKMGIPYRRFRCNDCGGWGRLQTTEKEIIKNRGRNAT